MALNHLQTKPQGWILNGDGHKDILTRPGLFQPGPGEAVVISRLGIRAPTALRSLVLDVVRIGFGTKQFIADVACVLLTDTGIMSGFVIHQKPNQMLANRVRRPDK